ncbi:MAG: hypothetical protein ACKKL5_01550 [Candidatus Komeilibacteria bacterium]
MEGSNNNLSDRQLRWAYWYLLHKKRLKKIGLFLFIALDIILIAWFVIGLIRYITNYNQFINLSQDNPNYINWIDYNAQHQPQPVQWDNPIVLSVGDGRSDIGARVFNPNDEWGVDSLTYHFLLAGGQRTASDTAFILPNQEIYLFALNVANIGRSATLQIEDLNWRRLKKSADLPDPTLLISNEEFITANQLSSGSAAQGRAVWQVKNPTIYSWWEPAFQVILFNGNNIVGFNYISLPFLDSLAEKQVSVDWSNRLPNVSKLQVIPLVNVYDSSALKQ